MKKPIVAMDISTTGRGGGPYTSTINLINSSLKEHYDFRVFHYKTELGRFISYKRIKDLMAQIRDINPDIVHFTGLQLSGFHIAIACYLLGVKKTIVVIHGSSTEALNIGVIKKVLIYLLESLTLLLTTTFYGVSKYSSLVGVTKLFRRKSSGYIYNLTKKATQDIQILDRADFGFQSDDIVVVTVGRITKDKGYHILTKSIIEFIEVPQIKFLIIGEGDFLFEMKYELKAQEKMNQVQFLGYRSDVLSILPMCDIFVLPTLHETLSIALLEASYCNLPLIASNVGGVPEIISNDYNGILVPPSDDQKITNAIKLLAFDQDLRTKMGANAKNKLELDFPESLIVEKVAEIYNRLLNN